jgi:hypothetical protein
MSAFSGSLQQVANTRIFARAQDGKEYLAYQFDYAADGPIALILPLPTPPDTTAEAVRFIDLSGYPEFFADMEKGFPYARDVSGANPRRRMYGEKTNDYQGTFYPTLESLSSLEEDFRIPDETWKQLVEYNDFGFAVVKISPEVHPFYPLALEFPMRTPNLLYFPTLHIRSGEAPEEASFDHDLFCQARAGWLRTYDVAGSFMDVDRAQGVVDAGERVSRMTVQGMHPNSDILVGLKA